MKITSRIIENIVFRMNKIVVLSISDRTCK
jgi:hypothetical protein